MENFATLIRVSSRGMPAKQVTTTGVVLGNISRWKLMLFSGSLSLRNADIFGTTKGKSIPNKNPGNARQRPGDTSGDTSGDTPCNIVA